jgi:hypothetical protein
MLRARSFRQASPVLSLPSLHLFPLLLLTQPRSSDSA